MGSFPGIFRSLNNTAFKHGAVVIKPTTKCTPPFDNSSLATSVMSSKQRVLARPMRSLRRDGRLTPEPHSDE